MKYVVIRYAVFLGIVALASLGTPGASFEDKKKADAKKGHFAHFKQLKYRSIGPAAGGRVSRSCGVPGDPTTWYVGSASGGVWKSTDSGATFIPSASKYAVQYFR